jgi:dTDP-glucose 4,6-dehydratase
LDCCPTLPPCHAPASLRHCFLHVSTDEVHGSLGPADPPFTEATPYAPRSPYSASKAAADHLARAWFHTYQLPVIVTSCSNNYGPFQFPEKLIPLVILKCLRREPVPVYGTGENIRDWLHVEDHCRALLAVLHRGTPGQTYHIGGNHELRNLDLVHRVCQLVDEALTERRTESQRPRPKCGDQGAGQASGTHPLAGFPAFQDSATASSSLISFVADRPGHDLRYAIDSTKIQRELGWTPRGDHDTLLRQTVAWYLDHPTWWQAILAGHYRLQRLGTAAPVAPPTATPPPA